MASNTPSIFVLPPSVTEKIAAGEVVERPASVVKELVENSLDSGATRIEITIEDAGFSSIRVGDNGSGMGPDDVRACVLRHATSKIKTADDLFCVATLGFRGEALASVGAVSRLMVASSADTDGLGCEIRCEGGAVSDPQPVEHVKGTTVVCRDLFFNTPARKKFMKSRKAERLALMRFIEQLVFPFPSVHFTFTMEGKRVLEAPKVDSPLDRIAQVAGTEFARNLVTCRCDNGHMSAVVHITGPAHATPRPRYQYLYVNLRRVDSESITFGIREAFSRFITQQLKPAWFCFLEVDPHRIDVNVHPAKQRIKFDDEKGVFGFAYKTIHASLPQALQGTQAPGAPSGPPASPLDAPGGRGMPAFVRDARVMEAVSTYAPAAAKRDDAVQTSLSFLSLAQRFDAGKKELEMPAGNRVQLREEQWSLIPCYQIHRLFILAPIKNGILLIDQHAAHERVLYEQALADLKTGGAHSQRLLFPVVIEVSTAEKSVLVSGREYFTALGFDIQDFGGKSISVSSVPAAGSMRVSGIEEAVREIVGYLLDEKDPQILAEPQRRYAAAYACGSAIRRGQELKQEEMNSLLNSLFLAENPYVCPHGRPTHITISLDELTRRFLR